jgi:hypothetical protein
VLLDEKAVIRDHELETKVDRSREALAKHRWHWTFDSTNPGRVTVAEYASAIGRHVTTVRDMVNGYDDWLLAQREQKGGAPFSLTDFLARAKLRGDTLAATEAVASAKGISIDAARRHHAEEVRQVKDAATERAERAAEPTTFEDEAQHVAEFRKRAADSARREKASKAKAHTMRYLSIEGKVARARRYLLSALTVAQDVEFLAEECEAMQHAADELRAILGLFDLRIAGDTTVDWDAEMVKLGERPE